jgi:hypothetical protein
VGDIKGSQRRKHTTAPGDATTAAATRCRAFSQLRRQRIHLLHQPLGRCPVALPPQQQPQRSNPATARHAAARAQAATRTTNCSDALSTFPAKIWRCSLPDDGAAVQNTRQPARMVAPDASS